MTEQENFTNCAVYHGLDSGLEAPHLKGGVHQLVRAHNRVVGLSPALEQGTTICCHRLELLGVLFFFVVTRLDLVKCNVNVVDVALFELLFGKIERLKEDKSTSGGLNAF